MHLTERAAAWSRTRSSRGSPECGSPDEPAPTALSGFTRRPASAGTADFASNPVDHPRGPTFLCALLGGRESPAHTSEPRSQGKPGIPAVSVRLGLSVGLSVTKRGSHPHRMHRNLLHCNDFRVGRRGLEPRTYGTKAFPTALQKAEYQAIATDSDSPRPSQKRPDPSRKGQHPEHERAM